MAKEPETKNRELSALAVIAQTVGRSLDLRETIGAALDKVLEVVGLEAGGIYVLDERAEDVILLARRGLEGLAERLRVGEGFLEEVSESKKPTLVDAQKGGLSVGDGQALMAVPLRSKGKMLGAMILAIEDRRLAAEELQLLVSIGRQIGMAAENSRLYEMVRRSQAKLLQRHKQALALNAIAQTLGQSLHLEEILGATLERVLEIMGMEVGWIRLLDAKDGGLRLGAYRGISAEDAEGSAPIRLGEGISGLVAQSGQPIMVDDISKDPRSTTKGIDTARLQSFLSVPLKSKDEVVGVMNLASREYHPFSPQEVELASAAGLQIGVAVENMRLFSEVEQGRKEWEETFSAMRDGIAIVDSELKVTRVNKALAEMLRLSPEEIIGRKCFEVFYRKGAPVEWCPHPRIVETGQMASIETDELAASGIFNISMYPLFDEKGRLLGIIHNFRDVTEDSALRNLLIQNEKLVALGRLAASIAHEINNPLFSIKNCLTLIAESEGDKEPRERFLRLAQGELDRMASIVQRMLDFARPAKEPVSRLDVNGLLADTLALMEKQLMYAKVKVHKDLGRIPTLVGSKDQLTQVFINMMLNAVEAMPGGGELRIVTKGGKPRPMPWLPQGPAKETVEVIISDTGAGISPENLERIFEPFFSTKEEVHGVGLGLSISYGIIQQHGGTIEAESEVGRGTTFIITLPVLSEDEWGRSSGEGSS